MTGIITLAGLVAGLGVVVGVVLAAGAAAKARLRRAYPPIGQMVDVGGYRLHALVDGQGGPTVVFDAGAGGVGLYWARVQPEIARTNRTVAYDRAGLGWSETQSGPRRFDGMADELYALLRQIDAPAPYVLVGHSFGGIVLRQFARKHPELVAGMVLVDSAHEGQFARRFPEPVRAMAIRMVKGMGLMVRIAASGIPALAVRRIPMTRGLPESAAEAERAVRLAGAKHVRAMLAEFAAIVHNAPEALEQGALGDMPLVVLSHGVPQSAPGLSDEVNAAYEASWQAMQGELAQLSQDGERILAEGCGHEIPLEAPDLVIDAIRSVTARALAGQAVDLGAPVLEAL